jgi:hypothetical protein
VWLSGRFGVEEAKRFTVFETRNSFLILDGFLLILTVNPKLPFSMDPEYEAASRAYMRYHNMDPIFGISSKYVCEDSLER